MNNYDLVIQNSYAYANYCFGGKATNDSISITSILIFSLIFIGLYRIIKH